MSILQNSIIPTSAAGYDLEQSLRFNDDDSAYLSWVPASASNRKTWTWSGWVKRVNPTGNQYLFNAGTAYNDTTTMYIGGDGKLSFMYRTPSVLKRRESTRLLRDISAWYHIVFSIDSTQSTASHRARIYVNGEEVLDFDDDTLVDLNQDHHINDTTTHKMSSDSNNGYGDGYLSEVRFIDGYPPGITQSNWAATNLAESFGETGDYGEWKPKKVTLTPSQYGNNGFYLPFNNDYTVEGFSATTYTGNGSTQYIGGVGFSPDLVWGKLRSSSAFGHALFDTVRGATKLLQPHATDPEYASSSYLSSFEADGFNVGSSDALNKSSGTYVAWSWDMGDTTVSNTSGSITSSVRASSTYGQSIVSWTGTGSNATVGHGLSSTPEMIIAKNRQNSTESWAVYHADSSATPATNFLRLNTDATPVVTTSAWNDTPPTSSVFSLGYSDLANGNGNNIIAYCFHSVSGYSKIGSYTGDSTIGHTVSVGFEPAFLMLKRAVGGTGNWMMFDTMRKDNTKNYFSYANQSLAEVTSSNNVKLTTTGFEILESGSGTNASGSTYIYMAFADKREAAFWLDQSGNNNDWTGNNLTESDVSVDSPTNNFATWNPLYFRRSSMQEGNLAFRGTTVGGSYGGAGTFLMESGKWYWEFVPTSSFNTIYSGIANSHNRPNSHFHTSAHGYWFESSGAAQRKITSGTNTTISGSNNVAGDVMQIAFDVDAGKIWFGKNNTWSDSGNPATGANAQYTSISNSEGFVPSYGDWGNTGYTYFNFGQDSSFAGNKAAQGNQDGGSIGDFYYTPPSGFLALCTKNLPDPAVIPNKHFNVIKRPGNNDANTSFTGVGFQPDLIWTKVRTSTDSHILYDAVRGTYNLKSDSTALEAVAPAITSYDPDGFTYPGNMGVINRSGQTYVDWCWKANGTGVSNTNGSINTTKTSANVDAGFSISTYTGNGIAGATIGHGLSATPELIMVKNRDVTDHWRVYHGRNTSAPETDWLVLNTAGGTTDDTPLSWNDTAPTENVFSIGTNHSVNANTEKYVAYCFHSVEGYSKMGTYGGTGATDGNEEEQPCIFTGFRPAYVMIKLTTGSDSWMIFDTEREPYNLADTAIFADSAAAESSSGAKCIDILSNGFKLRGTDGAVNGTAQTYIYIAFAETPFKYTNAR